MKRIQIWIVIFLALALNASAQDWQYDENLGGHYNCELIRYLFAEYGDEEFMKMGEDFVRSLGDVLVMLSAVCLDEEDRVIILGGTSESDESDEDAAGSAAEPDDDAVDVVLLEDHEEHTLYEVGCSVRVADRFEEGLHVSVAGRRRDSTSVDVRLPGESEPIEMPDVYEEDASIYGILVTIRNESAEGANYPLGRYRFEVHIDDASYLFEWQRKDESVNTIIVSCLELDTDGEIEAEVRAELSDGEFYALEESGCHLGTIDMEAEFFSVVVSGEDRDNIIVEVTYPQMQRPVEWQHVENFMSEEGRPMRIEWVKAPNYPTGSYSISLSMDKSTEYFRWVREDDAFRTIILTCLPK